MRAAAAAAGVGRAPADAERLPGPTTADLIAFSPNGKLIAGAADFRGTDIRDARTGRLVKRMPVGDLSGQRDYSRSVAFSPDGDLLFVGQFDGTGRLFSTETWKPVGRPLRGSHGADHLPGVHARRPHADHRRRGRHGRALGRGDPEADRGAAGARAEHWTSAALSPDGSRLYAISTRGEGISFDMSPEAWKRHACLVAGRELTADEWSEALPERPYQSACPGG